MSRLFIACGKEFDDNFGSQCKSMMWCDACTLPLFKPKFVHTAEFLTLPKLQVHLA